MTVFIFKGSSLLLSHGPINHWLPESEITPYLLRTSTVNLLTWDNGGITHCVYAVPEDTPLLSNQHCWTPLKTLYRHWSTEFAQLAGFAYLFLDWDQKHQFCGHCATPTVRHLTQKCRTCPSCQATFYPRITPVVMGLIRRKKEILLARSAHFTTGVYSVLAGHSEIGETLEQTLEREIKEEVGLSVYNIRYYASQSWPFPNALMIAFTCDYHSGTITPQVDEIEDARWFSCDQLPLLPNPNSIACQLIQSVCQSQ